MSNSGPMSSEEPEEQSTDWADLPTEGEDPSLHPSGSIWLFLEASDGLRGSKIKQCYDGWGSSVILLKTLVISLSFLSLVAHPFPQFLAYTQTSC